MSGVRISDGSPSLKAIKDNVVELNDGEVSERFKELVLKTSDSERGRGFESHPLRHIKNSSDILKAWRSTQVG